MRMTLRCSVLPGRPGHLRHEELDARNAEEGVEEFLAHALEEVGGAHVLQVQVAQDTPPNGCWEAVQHLHTSSTSHVVGTACDVCKAHLACCIQHGAFYGQGSAAD